MNKHKKSTTSGITILSLVVTVIVLLILAGISVSMLTGNNGIILNAGKAKESAGLAQEAEKIQSAILKTSSKTKFGDITINVLQGELDKEFGENQAEVIDNGDTIVVKIEEKYYEIDENGNISEPITLEKVEYAGDITKGGICKGTEANPYRIECIEDLVGFSKLVSTIKTSGSPSDLPFLSKKVILTKNLDFNSIFSYANYNSKYSYIEEDDAYESDENSSQTIKELCTTGKGFIPIGSTYSRTEKCFWGSFDGQGNTIKNIYINTEKNAGLFGGCGGATIKNITISGNITCCGSGNASSILVTGSGNTLNNCYNQADISNTGTGNASGISSLGSGKILKCTNKGNIFAVKNYAGGIATSRWC